MIVGGCDLGSATCKVIIVNDHKIVSHSLIPASARPESTVDQAMDEALQKAGLSSAEDLDFIMGTGYGRLNIPLFQANMSEIACHARGAFTLRNSIRTIIDIGGQDCKAISVNDQGRVVDFVMNDRCAAGTGRFFESMARALGCSLGDISSLSNQGEDPVVISSQCSVFAESEVITMIYAGKKLENIIAGINDSVASRLVTMIKKVGLEEELVLTGGCSKNEGLALALKRRLGIGPQKLSEDPQLVGALGAALFAIDRLNS